MRKLQIPAKCFCPWLCCTSLPWHRYLHPPLQKASTHTHAHTHNMCQYISPLASIYSRHHRGVFRLGQCHLPLCMWIIEIRLSTVIVDCVEPSVIVSQNVLRDFSTQEETTTKKGGTYEQLNFEEKKKERKKKKDKNTTQHERAFIVLCIYAIVYVWIWRIWKYMLTNLYRVFYVMWNTWSRCSLLSLPLSLFISFSLFALFFLFLFLGVWAFLPPLHSFVKKQQQQNRTYQKDSTDLVDSFLDSHVFTHETLDPVRNVVPLSDV